MRQRADGNKPGAGGGELRHTIEGHPARDLRRHSTAGTRDRFANLVRASGYREESCRRRRASASSTCARLCASISIGSPGRYFRVRSTAALTPPASLMWLSLISTASNSPARWLAAPPGAHRVFLDRAKRRRGFSRVEHGDPPARRVDESARARRDAREPLEKIERGALRGQQRRGRSPPLPQFLRLPGTTRHPACASEKADLFRLT